MSKTLQVMTAVLLTLAAGASGAVAQEGAVRAVMDVPYVEPASHPEKKDRLDLFLPDGREGFPVVLVIYGGGLRQGDKSEEEPIGRRLAHEGYGAAVVNYRLSPAVSHPAHVQDVAAAFAWVRQNIAAYGGDPDAVYVLGWSAGSYLTALLSLDGRYLEGAGESLASVRGAIPVSGFFHVERVAPARPKDVWGDDAQGWHDASPAQYVRRDAPPFLIIYADQDTTERKQESIDLAEALTRVGHRDVKLVEIADRTHAGVWGGIANAGDRALGEIKAFIERTHSSITSRR